MIAVSASKLQADEHPCGVAVLQPALACKVKQQQVAEVTG